MSIAAYGFRESTQVAGTDVFSGQWNQLLIGVRTGISVFRSADRFADQMQRMLAAYARIDIAVVDVNAFAMAEDLS